MENFQRISRFLSFGTWQLPELLKWNFIFILINLTTIHFYLLKRHNYACLKFNMRFKITTISNYVWKFLILLQKLTITVTASVVPNEKKWNFRQIRKIIHMYFCKVKFYSGNPWNMIFFFFSNSAVIYIFKAFLITV